MNSSMYGQTKIVLSSIFLFFVALIFVYLIYFDVNEGEGFYNIFSKNLQNESQQNGKNNSKSITGELEKDEEKLFTGDLLSDDEKSLDDGNSKLQHKDSDRSKSMSGKVENLEGNFENSDFDNKSNYLSGKEKSKQLEKTNYQKYLLSGMSLYTGDLGILEKLDLSNNFILKGKFNSFFALLESSKSSLDKKVEKLGGNIVEIGTKKNIIKNSLTGDKITYINIPQYDGVVNMIIVKDDVNWFIQVGEKNYYSFKSYLKDFFR